MQSDSEQAKIEEALFKFVVSAFDNKRKGDPRNLLALIDQLKSQKDPVVLTRWFKVMTLNVSKIRGNDRHWQQLHSAYLSFDWLNSTQECVQAYTRFLQALVTANGIFVVPTLTCLVSALAVSRVQPDAEAKQDVDERQLNMVYSMVHKALEDILRLIPTSTTHLVPILSRCFPHQRLDVITQQRYAKNLLRLSEYAPVLRDHVIGNIMERLVVLDAEAGAADAQADIDPTQELQFDVDLEEPDHNAAMAESSKTDALHKLNSLLELMLDYLRLVIKEGDSQTCDQVFMSLLRVTEDCVIPTHKSRATQFLLFYFTSCRHHFAEEFLKRLLQQIVDKETAPMEVSSLTNYLTGYIVRATFVRQVSSLHCFIQLLKWLHMYTDFVSQTQSSIMDSKSHLVFYCVFESVISIFCNRPDLFSDQLEHSPEQIEEYDMGTLVRSPLQPLKHCDYASAKQFVQLSHRLGLWQIRAEDYLFQAPSGVPHGITSHMSSEIRISPFRPTCRDTSAQSAPPTPMGVHRQPRAAVTNRDEWHLEVHHPFDPLNLPIFKTYFIDSDIYMTNKALWKLQEQHANEEKTDTEWRLVPHPPASSSLTIPGSHGSDAVISHSMDSHMSGLSMSMSDMSFDPQSSPQILPMSGSFVPPLSRQNSC